MQIKIIGDKGYILKGSIGIGFGAWGRAAWLRNTFKLADYPTSVQPEVWDKLDVEPTPVEWVHCQRDEQGRWFHTGFKK
jgi:hypothetical protein